MSLHSVRMLLALGMFLWSGSLSTPPQARGLNKTSSHSEKTAAADSNDTTNCLETAGAGLNISNCLETGNGRARCPPGLFWRGEDRCCQCGVYPESKLRCHGSFLLLRNHYCVTYNWATGNTSAGECVRMLDKSLIALAGHNTNFSFYTALPTNPSKLNKLMCKPLNRNGTLCGKCQNDYYPLAYSFNMTCIPCHHVSWNWVKYIMAAYLPLTIFYIAITFLKVNTTSSCLFASVYYCQTLSMPYITKAIFLQPLQENYGIMIIVKVLFSLYGIWNLDFFRPFYNDLCLKLDILPTLALDYAIAVYPLLLMAVSYLLIHLHDRNCKVVTFLWRPFRFLFSIYRKNWDIKTSFIDAFATFFFLSNIKFLSVSFDLLLPIRVYHLSPDKLNYTVGVFYAAEIQYFGKEHLPYAVLAILALGIFVLLPITILMCYPFSFFQKVTGFIPCRHHVLHTFVDSYYGCYKNGTQPTGTHDCRWFVSTFFLFRVVHFVIYTFMDNEAAPGLLVLSLLLHVTLLSMLKPFSSRYSHYNTINSVFLQLQVAFFVASIAAGISQVVSPKFTLLFTAIAALLIFLPFLCIAVGVLYWASYLKRRFWLDLFAKVRGKRMGYSTLSNDGLPDRIENSDQYPRSNLANFIHLIKQPQQLHIAIILG